jgi:hypothetical protein
MNIIEKQTKRAIYIILGIGVLSLALSLTACNEPGPQGPAGTTGLRGTNGTNGVNGATGATGTNGTNGTNGVNGATGQNGTNGTNGATGATGQNGTNGNNGVNGYNSLVLESLATQVQCPGSSETGGSYGLVVSVGLDTNNNSVLDNSEVTQTNIVCNGAPGQDYIPPVETNVQTLVDSENTWREEQGQTALTSGLSCSVQLLGSGQWLSSSSPGYQAAQGVVTALAASSSYSFLSTGGFNQPDSAGNLPNSVLPVAIQPLFENQNYKINCSGQLVVTSDGYYGFDLNSDDGSILTIDGTQVINNDGNHGMTDKQGTKLLREGVHTFSLLYAQSGGGNFGLVLQMNGSVLSGSNFYH